MPAWPNGVCGFEGVVLKLNAGVEAGGENEKDCVAAELKGDGEDVWPNGEDDDEGVKKLVGVELKGEDEVPKPVEVKDGAFEANILDEVEVLKGLGLEDG